MDQLQLSASHARLLATLDSAEAWFVELSDIPGLPIDAVNETVDHRAALGHLRTRAASTLINVAMFGAFSSGKTFLVSGLQGQLEVIEAEGSDGLPAEKFIGLLPSSPVPVSACPAQIVPVADDGVDSAGRGFMRVRFIDSADWEDVGSNPIPAMVAAYAAVGGDVVNRLPAHRRREVAQLEILISNYKIPAKLYDLPGYGSTISTHDAIIKTAMNDADCFIYVTRANRALGEEDLELIHVLYTHCKAWNKRVIWVVAGIDEATSLDHANMPGWRSVIGKNNEYIEQNFQLGGQPDRGFIGEGFIGASPASEARAAMHEAAGNGVVAGRLRAGSQMNSLREVIQNLIERESGPRHIADIASKARSLVGPLANAVSDRLREERVPVDKQAAALAAMQDRLRRADSAIYRLQDDLQQTLSVRVKRASSHFQGLAASLHAELDPVIRDTDLRNTRRANQVNNARVQSLQAWIERPGGPGELWDEQLAQFHQDMLGWLRNNIGANESATQLSGAQFDLTGLDLDIIRNTRIAVPDIVQRTALIAGIAAPAAATVTWIASAAVGGMFFPPAAAVAGAAALVYVGVQYFKAKNIDSLEIMRREWVAGLDSTAAAVKEHYECTLSTQGLRMIEYLAQYLESHRAKLGESIERIKERIADPDYQMSQDFVDELEPSSREGERLVAELDELRALTP
jgi:hypothetical protein